MKKNLQKFLSVLLAFSLCMSLLSGVVLAVEEEKTTSTGTVDVATLPGGNTTESVDVTITFTPSTNTTEKTTADGGDTTESGMNVVYKSTETKDDDGNVISGQSEYTATQETDTYKYEAEGGSETKTEEVSPNVTVDVPLTGDNPETEDVNEGSNTVTDDRQGGTVPTNEGDKLKSEDPANFDQTTTTVKPGSVTVTSNGAIVIVGNSIGGEYDSNKQIGLEPVASQWDNGKENVRKPVAGLSDEELAELDDDRLLPAKPLTQAEIAAALEGKPEGYDYIYIGLGEDSYYGVGWNYTSDTYYNGYGTGTHQFQLADFSGENVDPKVLEVISAYCADLETSSIKGYWYTIENVEDTDYFNEESANHIRAIAANGYWGTVNTDESGSPVTGSLEAVKKMMENAKDADGNPVFTEDQINNLTEGEALAATQMAIWKYGNPYQGEDKNIYLDADTLDYNNYQGKSAWYEGDSTNELYEQGVNSPEKITAALGRIDALANYLMSLSMTKEDAEKAGLGETEVIGETNFISDMSLTVIDKVADHENNADKISDNDAYNVNLTFALVVTPGENDDLIVKVIDGNNNVVSTARIAGDGTNDEGFSQITTTTDADGKTNYILSGLKLIENSDTTFNLKLEGAQYLEQGVYVYSSQIQDYDLDKDGVIEDRNSDGECEKNVSSQTFVGIAEGYKSVDVSMEVNLNFNVVDSTITTTREWRTEHDPVNKDTQPEPTPETPEEKPTPTTPPTPEQPKTEPNVQDIPDEDVPLTDIPDEDVPLAAVPQTGDMSPLWMLMSAVSGIGLAGTVVLRKKDEE